MPRTPNPLNNCSKRKFDTYVRTWRRGLHDYDPTEEQEDWDAKFEANKDKIQRQLDQQFEHGKTKLQGSKYQPVLQRASSMSAAASASVNDLRNKAANLSRNYNNNNNNNSNNHNRRSHNRHGSSTRPNPATNILSRRESDFS